MSEPARNYQLDLFSHRQPPAAAIQPPPQAHRQLRTPKNRAYACTCQLCTTRGPEAITPQQAARQARDEGWNVTIPPTETGDRYTAYCPECITLLQTLKGT